MRVWRRLTYADIEAMRDPTPLEDDPYLTDASWDQLPYERKFDPHDDQTRVLIRQYKALEALPHCETVVDRLERWRWLDTMGLPEQKQRYLEPLIAAVQRDPERHEDKLVFLLIVCEPVRRGVSRAFIRARAGLGASLVDEGAPSWYRREEARRLNEIEQQTLYDVTRVAALDALYRYPTPPPERFFPWLRAAIAHRALNHLRDELPQLRTTLRTREEAEAVQAALHGLDGFVPPEMRDSPNSDDWHGRIALRSVFGVTERYFEHSAVRSVCIEAVGRLPLRQRETIDFLFFQEGSVEELAARRRISRSTIYNQKAHALRNLHEDDIFFAGLCGLGKVRDRARARAVAERYPGGVLPDGRRVVVIEQDAA